MQRETSELQNRLDAQQKGGGPKAGAASPAIEQRSEAALQAIRTFQNEFETCKELETCKGTAKHQLAQRIHVCLHVPRM
jgi:hypothetical protein